MNAANANTILYLAAAQSSTFFRPSPHFLVAATVRELGEWTRQSHKNETELALRMEDGIDGPLQVMSSSLRLDHAANTRVSCHALLNH